MKEKVIDTRTIFQKRREADAYAGIGVKRGKKHPKKVVDNAPNNAVGSIEIVSDAVVNPQSRSRTMTTVTLKSLSKNGKKAVYVGAVRSLTLPIAAFDGEPPQSFEGPFKPAQPKLTKEEKKALRASQPKPTEAERIAKAEERLAKRKARLAAQQQEQAATI